MLSLTIVFTNCTDDTDFFPGGNYEPNYFGFETAELVIEVTPETKLFRINVECTHFASENVGVCLNKENTTAEHEVHFINTPNGFNGIGDFTLLEGKKMYKDVTIMPENIT